MATSERRVRSHSVLGSHETLVFTGKTIRDVLPWKPPKKAVRIATKENNITTRTLAPTLFASPWLSRMERWSWAYIYCRTLCMVTGICFLFGTTRANIRVLRKLFSNFDFLFMLGNLAALCVTAVWGNWMARILPNDLCVVYAIHTAEIATLTIISDALVIRPSSKRFMALSVFGILLVLCSFIYTDARMWEGACFETNGKHLCSGSVLRASCTNLTLFCGRLALKSWSCSTCVILHRPIQLQRSEDLPDVKVVQVAPLCHGP